VSGGETLLEVLVEEPSARRALEHLVPKIVPHVRYVIREFAGKDRLLKELPVRLRGYASRLTRERLKVAVLVDRDNDACVALKKRLDQLAVEAGPGRRGTDDADRVVLNRVVVEELEAWFFGDVPALRRAYPRLPTSLGEQAGFRDPDAIAGGTWEALARVLPKRGYQTSGMNKLRTATEVAPHMDVEANRSRSFQVFRDGLRRLLMEDTHAKT
jgi:Domain of unknown function (DUF4276)